MKKILISIITLLAGLMVFTTAYAKKTEETKEKEVEEVKEVVESNENLVKVYIFEAGGCPACQAQIEYLKGLDSYNKKFEIVEKELYVDHVDWAHGKDYELGKKVAEEFIKAGFRDAAYNATPFVVISNAYAKAAYNSSLESVIDSVYEEGDKDIVGCFERNEENCVIKESTGEEKNYDTIIIIGIFVVLIGGCVGLVIASKK